jgi:hypothetical protein
MEGLRRGLIGAPARASGRRNSRPLCPTGHAPGSRYSSSNANGQAAPASTRSETARPSPRVGRSACRERASQRTLRMVHRRTQ